jgi:hypothetical protein
VTYLDSTNGGGETSFEGVDFMLLLALGVKREDSLALCDRRLIVSLGPFVFFLGGETGAGFGTVKSKALSIAISLIKGLRPSYICVAETLLEGSY